MNETFGALLKRAREAQRLKAFEVAEQVGIKPSTLSRYENDQQKEAPPPKVLADLARVLEVSEPYMLRALGYLRTVAPGEPEVPFPGDPLKTQAVRIIAGLNDEFTRAGCRYLEYLRDNQPKNADSAANNDSSMESAVPASAASQVSPIVAGKDSTRRPSS